MSDIAVIDMQELAITPVFKLVQLENIPKSEHEGYAVMETHEVVEVRIAGSRNFAPVFPSDAFWQREGNRVITYAERWADQYAAFKNGAPQEALGTPLEMLARFGITPEQISLCRSLKIYSIEALGQLESDKLKTLGMHQNKLKDAATKFLAERNSGAAAYSEIAALQARIAELEARSTVGLPVNTGPDDVDAALAAADAASDAKSLLKDRIEEMTGTRPRGNPSEETLRAMLAELEG